jgi:SAM-dependent methyltransferase
MVSAEETAGGVLAGAMWSYAALVLEPARAAKRIAGHAPDPALVAMAEQRGAGLGPLFSRRYDRPQLLDKATKHDHLVEEFDRLSEAYDAYVRPFSTPIFAEALRVLSPLLTPDARVLDAGCGPGRELRTVARRLVDGEVVGIDLAAGMVVSAHRGARASGLDNTAFVQSDVGDLPEEFEGAFDLAYNCLAHHHYPDPAGAAAGIFRSLRPGGVYAIVDPGPAWFVAMSSALSKVADPGWVGFHTPGQFSSLLGTAGFVDFRWVDLLPGFGLAIGRKPQQPDL